jgi:hypothetical protein
MGPFLFAFSSAEERLEWCAYLSQYILHSFLSPQFLSATRVHEVDSAPLCCLHQCSQVQGHGRPGGAPSSSSSSSSSKQLRPPRASQQQQHLHLDWLGPESALWCLRLSSGQLQHTQRGQLPLAGCLPVCLLPPRPLLKLHCL